MAKGHVALALATAVVLAVLPATASAAGKPMPMGTTAKTISIGPITAGTYELTLEIAPLQHMYTRAQYNRMHPKTGELMMGGTMVMGGMGMGKTMPNRHIELHVLDRRMMRVVTNAMVTITYQPVMGMGGMASRPQQLPIATMIDIGKGMASFHYGNNAYLAPRATYHIAATVNKVHALFTVRLG